MLTYAVGLGVLGYSVAETRAAQLVGVTSAVFEWAPATGPVNAYLVYVARNSDVFPAFPEAIASSAERRVTVQGHYGEHVRVRVVALDASMRTGPFSLPSDDVVFVPGPSTQIPPFDFDADGRSELLLQSVTSGALTAWTLGAVAPLRAIASGQPDLSWTVEDSGDYDGDGRADLMWRDPVGQRFVLCRSDGNDVNLCATYLPAAPGGSLHGLGDANADGLRDFVLRLAGGTTSVCEGAGLAPGVCGSLGVFDLGWRFTAAGDLDGDGRADLLVQESATGTTLGCTLVGSAVQGCSVFGLTGLGLTARGIGDLTGDGRAEIVLRNRAFALTLICSVSGSTLTSCSPIAGIDSRWELIGVADYDADGLSDLVFRDLALTAVRIELLQASGPKSAPLVLPVGSSFRVIAR